ncbi:glycosyltransferase family 4 protein [Lutibacter sp. B1]|uniref:glycosyltransferase family 4 protein n=1 Tax=Lutibacter sp. B1 TaxID=2725996 RepID=UPI0014576C0B|nr:glycosyltransferase family 4 protein [Lutibacter sp. B1]NLP58145.1 glycosyltransferase family 4 protein [Lutibacter sp. B1]
MNKKVIWIINQTAGKPDSGWGERHYYLAKYWVNNGYNVKIISGSYNHLFINQPKISKKTFTIEEVEENITFCWVKTPRYNGGGYRKFWSNIIYTLKVFFISSKTLSKPSYLIVSSMPIFPIINGYFFKKWFNAEKLIFEVRDLWPLTPVYLKGYSKKHPLIKIVAWFEKFAYKKADVIVSLLPNAYNYIDKISGNPSKFNWIPNGIDESLLDNENLSENLQNQIPSDKFIVGYAGTLGMANAMEYFIEASVMMKEISQVHFVIVGDGYLKQKYVVQTKTNTNITFINKIKKNQVQSILKLFDVCYVGRYNNKLYDYGVSYNKYFDYMLAGKPILESSNNINSPAEISGCGIIIEPESGEAIVHGIQKFQLKSKDEMKKIGKKGYVYVKNYHNFEYLSNKYITLFKCRPIT